MQVFNYIDTIIVFVIPFTLIVVLNSFTSLAVWKFGGVRRSMTMERRLDRRLERFQWEPARKTKSFRSQNETDASTVEREGRIHQQSELSQRSTKWRHSIPKGWEKTCVWLKSLESNPKIPVCKNTANASQAKVTKMLLIVSTAFVCLNLPSYTLRIVAFHVVVVSHFLRMTNDF